MEFPGQQIEAQRRRPRQDVLTIGLEDYFHGRAFDRIIDRRQWSRFETHLEKNAQSALDLLDRHGARATFFVMSPVAEKCPWILREVVRRGHEVGSAGAGHRTFRDMSREEFRRESRHSKEVIEQASGHQVRGFRIADRRLTTQHLWVFDVLAEEGYAYDSSLSPSLFHFSRQPWRRFVHLETTKSGPIWEFPLPALSALGCMIPIAGGNYFRQFPETLVKAAVGHWHRTHQHAFVMYFRIWDLDPDQPRITAAPFLAKLRHYRNGGKMPGLLAHFLERNRFTSIEDYLGLSPLPVSKANQPEINPAIHTTASIREQEPTPVTLVVPCFNEELVLPYLANTLQEVEEKLGALYDFHYILVDDGSSDSTWKSACKIFGHNPRFTLLRHRNNQGVAAAILTGIRHASTEIVSSIDCDCTYDPHELEHMIPMLKDGVDLVTASPYHPDGEVVNVPRWRLGLSRGASWLYGLILRQPIHTYTSCFRIYRRSTALQLNLQETGFLGIAELMGRTALQGSKIVEHPTTLETRMLGRSKMRVLRTVIGHLRLMGRLIQSRLQPLRLKPGSSCQPQHSVEQHIPGDIVTFKKEPFCG